VFPTIIRTPFSDMARARSWAKIRSNKHFAAATKRFSTIVK
jgi:hypothetical protein